MFINDKEFRHIQSLLGSGFDRFLNELLDETDELQQLLDNGADQENIDKIRSLSHSLKSISRQTGLVALGNIAREIEKATYKDRNVDPSYITTFNAEKWAMLAQELAGVTTETRAALDTYR